MVKTYKSQLPLLQVNQSGKEVTHNETLIILDALISNNILGFANEAPATPTEGDVYIIQNGINDWNEMDNQIAIYNNGWRYIAPRTGMLYYLAGKPYLFNSTSWSEVGAAILRDYIAGLEISVSGNDISVSVGQAADSTNANYINLAGAITKSLDGAWIVGNGLGGLANGLTKSENTSYFVFLIKNASGVVDCGFDTSLTGDNLLDSEWVYYRRIGSIITDASGDVIDFYAACNGGEVEYIYRSPIEGYGDSASTDSVLCTLTVPAGLRVMANIRYQVQRGTATLSGYVSSPECDDAVVDYVNRNAFSASASNPAFFYGFTGYILTNTNKQIRKRESIADGGTSRITIYGYKEQR